LGPYSDLDWIKLFVSHRIHGAVIDGVPWIPSIYPSHVSIYTSTMDLSWVSVCYILFKELNH
jgi:hypothetical protein